jgi:hypothetical protein
MSPSGYILVVEMGHHHVNDSSLDLVEHSDPEIKLLDELDNVSYSAFFFVSLTFNAFYVTKVIFNKLIYFRLNLQEIPDLFRSLVSNLVL